VLRPSPIDPRELCRGYRYRTVRCCRPDEAAALQPLRKQAGTVSIMPNDFYAVTSPAAKNKEMPAMGIVFEHFLHQKG